MTPERMNVVDAAARFAAHSDRHLENILPTRGKGPDNTGEPPGGDDMLKEKVSELERNFLQVAMNIASMRTKIEDMPSKDWVHLRLWAVAGFIVAAVGVMIMFLPSAR